MARVFYSDHYRRTYSALPLFRTICQQSLLARTLAGRMKDCHEQLARFASHSFFLKRCLEMNLVPKGFHLRYRPKSAREERWKTDSERSLVSLNRREASSRCFQLREGISQLDGRLQPLLPPELLNRLRQACNDQYQRTFHRTESVKAKKFNNLLLSREWEFRAQPGRRLPRPPATQPPPAPPLFLSIASKQPSPDEIAFLSLGAKFGRSGNKIQLDQIAARVEHSAASLANRGNFEESERFRAEAIEAVKALPDQTVSNLTPAQVRGLRSFKADPERIVTRADKSETLVVQDRSDYEEKLRGMMETPDYEKLDFDPYVKRPRHPDAAKKFGDELKAVFVGGYVHDPASQASETSQVSVADENEDRPTGPQAALKAQNPQRYYEYKKCLKTHGACSAVHCLPKIHKLGPPPSDEEERKAYVGALKLRIIAPSYASVDKPLCQHLTKILSAIPRPAHSLRNLEAGVSTVQSFCPNPNSLLVSFDISAMYPSISVVKACGVIQSQLEQFEDLNDHTTLQPAEITRLLRYCLEHTYLQTGEGEWWRQRTGLAMGKSISSIVAERYMLHLEERIEAESPLKPSLYMRWVDDTLAVWDHGEDALHAAYLPFLNALDPDLKWTLELEKNQQISFLDMTIFRKPTHLETTVFRKESNIRHFVPAQSHHPRAHKMSALLHGFRRAYKYCSTESLLQAEITNLHLMFHANGYSHLTISEIQSKVKRQTRLASMRQPDPVPTPDRPHDLPIKVGLPYIGKWNRKIEAIGQKFGVFFASSNKCTVRRSFPTPKVPQDASVLGGSVYLIQCQCPDGAVANYVGQTGGRLKDRAKQHEDGWKKDPPTGSFSQHPRAAGHNVQFQDASVLTSEESYPIRVNLEAFNIAKVTASGDRLIANENFATRDRPRVNKSDGIRLSPLWRPIIARL